MKRLFFVLVAMVGFAFSAQAQCGDDLMKTALKAMGDKQYIKDFEINLASGSADGKTFQVVLNSNTMYQFNVANGPKNAENLTFDVTETGGNVIGTNSMGGKVYPNFQFKCTKTAAYKLRVYSTSASESCARAVLSLVEQF